MTTEAPVGRQRWLLALERFEHRLMVLAAEGELLRRRLDANEAAVRQVAGEIKDALARRRQARDGIGC